MRVVFVLRSAEIFPVFLRFVLPLLINTATLQSADRNFDQLLRTDGWRVAYFFLSYIEWERYSSTDERYIHRSHFGSRYPFRLKRLASLFVLGSNLDRGIF
jgi:hypothetical protein